MKRITIKGEKKNMIDFNDVGESTPIFAKDLHGKLVGMVVKESGGWILRIGGSAGSTGHYNILRDCLLSGQSYDYEFFVED